MINLLNGKCFLKKNMMAIILKTASGNILRPILFFWAVAGLLLYPLNAGTGMGSFGLKKNGRVFSL
ncbi:hypothetical protein C0V77_11315 [Emticicia sp. TH156]|nr:hypothetical protein C0V77_11315 [Emticicia sp. TH156]